MTKEIVSALLPLRVSSTPWKLCKSYSLFERRNRGSYERKHQRHKALKQAQNEASLRCSGSQDPWQCCDGRLTWWLSAAVGIGLEV